MAALVAELLAETMKAYETHDVDKAVSVWNRDEEVDEMYTSLLRETLTYMMEDVRNITSSTHGLFIAKKIERMGDHATNVADWVHYLVTGRRIEGGRPKGDATSFETGQAD